MRVVRVQILKTQAVIADECFVAESLLDRTRGLIGRKGLTPGQAMLFPKCNSIHMWLMGFSIDVVFIREGRVSSVHADVRPWKMLPLLDWRGKDALELPSGTIRRLDISRGDELCIS